MLELDLVGRAKLLGRIQRLITGTRKGACCGRQCLIYLGSYGYFTIVLVAI